MEQALSFRSLVKDNKTLDKGAWALTPMLTFHAQP